MGGNRKLAYRWRRVYMASYDKYQKKHEEKTVAEFSLL